MENSRLSVPRISDAIADQLEMRILEGSLKAGDRLAPERELATEFGVSRPSVREAIQKLASRGLLTSRHGGGNFVTDRLESAFVDPWQEMLGKHPVLQEDLLEFRHMLEGRASELAARRATDDDLLRLERAFEKLDAAYRSGEATDQVDADVAFHQAIAEASHNVMFGHLSASLLKVTHHHIDRNLINLRKRPEQWHELMVQHKAIWDAIRTGDATAAGNWARAHMDFVAASMMETERLAGRRESARRRLADDALEGA